MTGDMEDRIFELRYWQQISNDLGEQGRLVGEIGREVTERLQEDPMAYVRAADLITFILARVEAVAIYATEMQNLVSGRLTALEERLDG